MNPPISSYFTYISRVLKKWNGNGQLYSWGIVATDIDDVYWNDDYKRVVIADYDLFDQSNLGSVLLHSNTVVRNGILYEVQDGLVLGLRDGIAYGMVADDDDVFPYAVHDARVSRKTNRYNRGRPRPSLHDTVVSHADRISELCQDDGLYYDTQATVEIVTLVPGLRVAKCEHCDISETHLIIELDRFVFVEGTRVNGYAIRGNLGIDDCCVYYRSYAGIVTRCMMNDRAMRVKTARHVLVLVGPRQIIMFQRGLVCELSYPATDADYINVIVSVVKAAPIVGINCDGKYLHNTCCINEPFMARDRPYVGARCAKCKKVFDDMEIVATKEFMLQSYNNYIAKYSPGQSTDNELATTVCGHSFHLHCLVRWMEKNEMCPLCRRVTQIRRTTMEDPDETCAICLDSLGDNIHHIRDLARDIWSN